MLKSVTLDLSAFGCNWHCEAQGYCQQGQDHSSRQCGNGNIKLTTIIGAGSVSLNIRGVSNSGNISARHRKGLTRVCYNKDPTPCYESPHDLPVFIQHS